uniref:Uncharacterized protein n=1 Tax=Siphoviridae sp. ctJ0s2 TaxID=2827834 RepID=A0A8S5TE62_9CAUD|nr:MAG TPA: hypothetical protein [Siphoviridae sp. ctJ0s2]
MLASLLIRMKKNHMHRVMRTKAFERRMLD